MEATRKRTPKTRNTLAVPQMQVQVHLHLHLRHLLLHLYPLKCHYQTY